MKFLGRISDMQKGIAYLVFGILILLDALNVLSTTVHYVILFAAISLIIYGILLTGLVKKFFEKK